jgi:hypothetical protein
MAHKGNLRQSLQRQSCFQEHEWPEVSLAKLPTYEARAEQLEAAQRLCNTDFALIEGTDARSDPGRPGLLRGAGTLPN